MEFIQTIFWVFLHLQDVILSLVSQYGTLAYILLDFVIFLETGLVLVPFLPGDSLLFAAGTLAAQKVLSFPVLLFSLWGSAVAGDSVNYWVGRMIGHILLKRKMIKPSHYQQAHLFYERHGKKAVILARFVPIVRTIIPFIAGAGMAMPWRSFFVYSVLGGFVWVTLFLSGGYFFGNIPFVRNNFEIVVVAIILISFVPLITHTLQEQRRKK